MEQEDFNKIMAFGAIILLLAFLAYTVAISALNTANINNVFEVVVNNTNKAPQFPGEIPGTGERVTGGIYYTNESPIEIFVFAHASSISQTAEVHLHINGTIVEVNSGRPLGAAESSNKSVVAIIPKGSNYTVEIFNFHHYEWREYPILSGKNGTLSINQTTNINQTFNGTNNHSQLTNLNWSVAGHIIDSNIQFVKRGIGINGINNSSSIIFSDGSLPDINMKVNDSNGSLSKFEISCQFSVNTCISSRDVFNSVDGKEITELVDPSFQSYLLNFFPDQNTSNTFKVTDGNISHTAYFGSGNAGACLDPTGTLFRATAVECTFSGLNTTELNASANVTVAAQINAQKVNTDQLASNGTSLSLGTNGNGRLRLTTAVGGSNQIVQIGANNLFYLKQATTNQTSQAQGAMFFNTSDKCIYWYNGTVWKTIC